MNRVSSFERAAQTRRLLRSEGCAGVKTRLLERASNLLSPAGTYRLRVAREELVRAAEIASAGWPLPTPLPARADEPLELAWVCVPLFPGAGGHTTLVRIISCLENAGHHCTIYLHDRHGWSLKQHRRNIRSGWPRLKADVRDAADGIEDAHGVFATSWETAYKVLTSDARGLRFYLVQDFEPWFYPAGSEALMAEATYRFGFHGITAGAWLADFLGPEYGMVSDYFDFGCDLDSYSFQNDEPRTGVCLYSRPTTARRGFELCVAALDLFAERHPEIAIHLFGEDVPIRGLPFPAEQHGQLRPKDMNELYNACAAGLVLSATNVSLVPHEMLAAGCIPVVNDAPRNRVVLDNSQVAYAPATPFDLANALSLLVERSSTSRQAAARAAANSVRGRTWEEAGGMVETSVRDAVMAAQPQSPAAAER